jgi:ketosteroid isomerase-like protein
VGNLDTARVGYAAWNRRDADEMVSHVTEDVVVEPSGMFPGTEAMYRGREEFAHYLDVMMEPWEKFTIEPQRLIEVDGERLVGLVRFRGRGRHGIEVERDFGHVLTFRDGLLTHLRSYESWDDALAAAGVAE